ncbi:MAG: biotin transporter BioY [Clostridiales bacterium]|nr:biotin transporter BioY [Clostridiales bacterium]
MKKTLSIKNICLCALFTALVAIGAFLKISIEPIAITFQLFFVTLSGMILGSKLGAVSCLTYMLIGLIGIPIFTQGGGIGYVLKPSFGYIIGFIFGSFVAGLIIEKSSKLNYKALILSMLSCILVVYIIGIIYFYFIMRFHLGKEVTLKYIFINLFLLLIPGDLITGAIAVVIAKRVIPIVKKIGNNI